MKNFLILCALFKLYSVLDVITFLTIPKFSKTILQKSTHTCHPCNIVQRVHGGMARQGQWVVVDLPYWAHVVCVFDIRFVSLNLSKNGKQTDPNYPMQTGTILLKNLTLYQSFHNYIPKLPCGILAEIVTEYKNASESCGPVVNEFAVY